MPRSFACVFCSRVVSLILSSSSSCVVAIVEDCVVGFCRVRDEVVDVEVVDEVV